MDQGATEIDLIPNKRQQIILNPTHLFSMSCLFLNWCAAVVKRSFLSEYSRQGLVTIIKNLLAFYHECVL